MWAALRPFSTPNFGFILAMAGFRPSGEFYKPDLNPSLPAALQGTLIREQVLGSYTLLPDTVVEVSITSEPVTEAAFGAPYSYQVTATGVPAPTTFGLDEAPTGMTISDAGLVE